MTTPLSQQPYISQELMYGPAAAKPQIVQTQNTANPSKDLYTSPELTVQKSNKAHQEQYISPPLTAQNSTHAPQEMLYLPPKAVVTQQVNETSLPLPPIAPLPAASSAGKAPIAMPYTVQQQQKTTNPYLLTSPLSPLPASPVSSSGKVPNNSPSPVQQQQQQNTNNPYLPTSPSSIPQNDQKDDGSTGGGAKIPPKILVIIPTKNVGDGQSPTNKKPLIIVLPKLLNETTSGNDVTSSAVNKPVQDPKQAG